MRTAEGQMPRESQRNPFYWKTLMMMNMELNTVDVLILDLVHLLISIYDQLL